MAIPKIPSITATSGAQNEAGFFGGDVVFGDFVQAGAREPRLSVPSTGGFTAQGSDLIVIAMIAVVGVMLWKRR